MAPLFWVTGLAAFRAAPLLRGSWVAAYTAAAHRLGAPPPPRARTGTPRRGIGRGDEFSSTQRDSRRGGEGGYSAQRGGPLGGRGGGGGGGALSPPPASTPSGRGWGGRGAHPARRYRRP